MYNLDADAWLFVAASQKESGLYPRMATGEKTSLKKIVEFVKNNVQVQKEKRKFRRRLFTTSIIRERRHFPLVVVQWRWRNVEKSVMHVQSCGFAY